MAGQASAIYLAEFQSGIPYVRSRFAVSRFILTSGQPSNNDIAYCKGKVCHEDDILAVFGNSVTPLTSTQQALQTEVVARWLAFIKSGSPNAAGYTTWSPVVSPTKLNLLALGAGQTSSIRQTQAPLECGPNGIWGSKIPYDVQLYGP